ncbi:MAG: hypothetical protein HFI96_06785 [Lachnospiraceae bacterium]|nr:hypothetical protein [Lachnospiraceae bacterium]MCI9096284.1 hypothetical protein [Lachnospiraceae bacterium]
MGTNVKRMFKKCPFLLLLTSTGILFSLIGLWGHKNIYAGQEYDPLREPALVMMFQGLKEDIYPWQILEQESAPVMAQKEEPGPGTEKEEESAGADTVSGGGIRESEGQGSGSGKEPAKEEQKEEPEQEEAPVQKTPSPQGDEEEENPPKEEEEQEEEELPKGRIEPLRESTREEYLNHISADIYGDVGVRRAAEYEFTQVDESYFDDALFIGDSRTVGLRDYTDLSEHADFYCETSLTIQKILTENFPGLGTIEEALAGKAYGKIYIMLGINELGLGTTENFMEKYTEVVDFLCEKAPQARIFVQGIMRVTGKKHHSDAIFNNNNINARNNAIATLADNEQIFYIDVNEVVCDEEGHLNTEYTYDQLHLLGMYNDLWKQFLMSHGVQDQPQAAE